MIQKVKLHCKIAEFGNLVTIKEKGCQIKKGIRKNMKTYQSKTSLLFAYHPITPFVL
jgi:hypothetical protein